MKTKLTMIMAFALAGSGIAGEAQFSPGEIIHPPPSVESVTTFNGIPLGKSHLKLEGLLFEGAVPRDIRQNRSVSDKLLALPVVNLMVRKTPPPPSDRGSYFSWKDSSRRPWVSTANQGAYRGPFSTFSGDGPTPGLVSLSF